MLPRPQKMVAAIVPSLEPTGLADGLGLRSVRRENAVSTATRCAPCPALDGTLVPPRYPSHAVSNMASNFGKQIVNSRMVRLGV